MPFASARRLRSLAAPALILAAALLGGGCGGDRSGDAARPAFTSDVIVGHEELVRLAIDRANAELERMGDPAPYKSFGYAARASRARSPLVRGNWATDAAERVPELRLDHWYGLAEGERLSDSPTHQDIHFLRNHTPPQGALATCRAGHERIVKAFQEALIAWEDGDEPRALFFLGHATHTVQDSFSKAHTRRSADGRSLLDICTRGVGIPGVCRHRDLLSFSFDPADVIWRNPLTCPFTRAEECLKPEAAAAVEASAGLLVLAQHLRGAWIDPIYSALAVLDFLSFDDGSLGAGRLACETLPRN